jgi:hypothetical protein
MSQFVDECRREWKRLGVPDAIANEMAADLAADLDEAEAEGVPPEDVLGNGVFDARAFAAAWAGERGVIPSPPARERFPRGSRRLSIAVALAGLIAIGAGLVVLRSSGESRPVAVVAMQTSVAAPREVVPPGLPFKARVVRKHGHFVRVPLRRQRVVRVPAYGPPFTVRGAEVGPAYAFPGPPPFKLPVIDRASDDKLRVLGWILVILGVGGLVLAAVLWPRRRGADPAPPSPSY